MKNPAYVILLAVISAFSLIMGLVIPALAADPVSSGSQSWNLDSEKATPDYLCQMEKREGPGDDGQNGEILLTAVGGSQIWIADEAATGTVVFRQVDTAWDLELVTDQTWVADVIPYSCIVDIGEWDGDSFNKFDSVVQFATIRYPSGSHQMVITFSVQLANETVHKDCYLAVRVTNSDSLDHTIFCGEGTESTCFTSPGGDPGYPNPPTVDVPASSGTTAGLMIGGFAALMVVLLLKVRWTRQIKI